MSVNCLSSQPSYTCTAFFWYIKIKKHILETSNFISQRGLWTGFGRCRRPVAEPYFTSGEETGGILWGCVQSWAVLQNCTAWSQLSMEHWRGEGGPWTVVPAWSPAGACAQDPAHKLLCSISGAVSLAQAHTELWSPQDLLRTQCPHCHAEANIARDANWQYTGI